MINILLIKCGCGLELMCSYCTETWLIPSSSSSSQVLPQSVRALKHAFTRFWLSHRWGFMLAKS